MGREAERAAPRGRPAPRGRAELGRALARARARAGGRGITLVELLAALAILVLVTGAAVLGSGVQNSARLKRSALLVSSAIKNAYASANQLGRPMRLVFDFDARRVTLQEADSPMLLARGEKSGGAEPATEAEREATAEVDAILKGPRAPRASFKAATSVPFNKDEDGTPGRALEPNVRFLSVDAQHQSEPEVAGQAYLYFWPGGRTELAAIQLLVGRDETDDFTQTIVVSPLTGKTRIVRGRVAMPKPRSEAELSEREDSGR
jgi:general secretion pathway protein H